MKNNITLTIQYHADSYTMMVNNVPEALKVFSQMMVKRDGFFDEGAAHIIIKE